VEQLEERCAPAGDFFAVGADAGSRPQVTVFDSAGTPLTSFNAFPPTFSGGVRVAIGDVNGDGIPDIVCGAGPGGGPQVTIFSGKDDSPLSSFYAFTPTFTGGLNVAVADLNGDGLADIIVGADSGGGPEVRVFNGKDLTLISDFFALPSTFTGGVRVAAAVLPGIGPLIIAAAGPGAGPQVSTFTPAGQPLQSFDAFPPSFTGGVNVAVGDTNGDGVPDVITGAGSGGGPQVMVFDGSTLNMLPNPPPKILLSVYAFPSNFTFGVRVAAQASGSGSADILALPGPGAPALTPGNLLDGLTGTILRPINISFSGSGFGAGNAGTSTSSTIATYSGSASSSSGPFGIFGNAIFNTTNAPPGPAPVAGNATIILQVTGRGTQPFTPGAIGVLQPGSIWNVTTGPAAIQGAAVISGVPLIFGAFNFAGLIAGDYTLIVTSFTPDNLAGAWQVGAPTANGVITGNGKFSLNRVTN
jgi:hypothetical protein